jgi:hypothetical protein
MAAVTDSAWILALDPNLEPRPDRPAIIGPLPVDGELRVGRDPKCDVLLDSRCFPSLISRSHAMLRVQDGVPMLHDTSLNGCDVDGVRKTQTAEPRIALREGSRVIFGVRGSETEFVYSVVRRPQLGARGQAKPLSKPRTGTSALSEPGGEGSSSLDHTIPSDGPGSAQEMMMEELQCCICAELLVRPCTLSCSHSFCSPCIYDWERRSRTCVICREELQKEPPKTVRNRTAYPGGSAPDNSTAYQHPITAQHTSTR